MKLFLQIKNFKGICGWIIFFLAFFLFLLIPTAPASAKVSIQGFQSVVGSDASKIERLEKAAPYPKSTVSDIPCGSTRCTVSIVPGAWSALGSSGYTYKYTNGSDTIYVLGGTEEVDLSLLCGSDASCSQSLIQGSQSAAKNSGLTTSGIPGVIGDNPIKAPTKVATAGLCDGVLNSSDIVNFSKLGVCMSGVIYVFAIGITTPFAYLGASVFEVMIPITLSGSIYASGAVAAGWTVVRDVANIAFLFILIYIAFSVMLENFGPEMKKALVNVIIVALIVNFSFFISRIVIDAGNLVGLAFYKAINTQGSNLINATSQPAPQGQIKIAGFEIVPPKPITEVFMRGINLQKIIDNENFKNFTEGAGRSDFITTLMVMSFIFLTMGAMLAVLAYVFLYAAVRLIVRVVVLWFTIILSPLAFVAWILPATNGLAHKWWDIHIKNALFPAAFLFGLYVIAQILSASDSMFGFSQWQEVFKNLTALNQTNADWLQKIAIALASVAVRCIFLVVMLLGALKIADMFGHEGAGMAKGFAKWVGGRYVGTLGMAGRQTVGRFGSRLGRSSLLQDTALRYVGGRQLAALGKWTGKRSFDARAPLGAIGAGGYVDGKAQKGGFKAYVDEYAKKSEEKGKEVKFTDEEKAYAEAAAERKFNRDNEGDVEESNEKLTDATNKLAEVQRSAGIQFKEAVTELKGLEEAMIENPGLRDDPNQQKRLAELQAVVSAGKEHAAAKERVAELDKERKKAVQTVKDDMKAREDSRLEGQARSTWFPWHVGASRRAAATKIRKLKKEKSPVEKIEEQIKKLKEASDKEKKKEEDHDEAGHDDH